MRSEDLTGNVNQKMRELAARQRLIPRFLRQYDPDAKPKQSTMNQLIRRAARRAERPDEDLQA